MFSADGFVYFLFFGLCLIIRMIMTICDKSHVTPPAITGGDISMDISFCSSGGIFSLPIKSSDYFP